MVRLKKVAALLFSIYIFPVVVVTVTNNIMQDYVFFAVH